MRIIAGKHRGRRIDMIAGKEIRPTSSRTREAIFNIISHGAFGHEDSNPLIGKRVMDLYCGSGAFGLEALSRGASHVTFVDKNRESLALAQHNAERMNEGQNVLLLRADATQLSAAREPCSLIFLDPPYLSGLIVPTLLSLVATGWAKKNSILIVEHSPQEQVSFPDTLTKFDERKYGNSMVSLLRV